MRVWVCICIDWNELNSHVVCTVTKNGSEFHHLGVAFDLLVYVFGVRRNPRERDVELIISV